MPPAAIKVRLVMDNLSTHSIASFYQVFEPATARQLAERLEIHYTPKHGSWLNMAEIEFSALSRQCLNRRIPDMDTLADGIAPWQDRRNARCGKIKWHFTACDARTRLQRLYPKL